MWVGYSFCFYYLLVHPPYLLNLNPFTDEMPFILHDEDYKTKYRIELKSAVVRARASPGALLKGLDIWLATNVQPPINTLSAIVKAAGGNVS